MGVEQRPDVLVEAARCEKCGVAIVNPTTGRIAGDCAFCGGAMVATKGGLLPLLIPRTKSGLPKLAVTRAEAADLLSKSVDTVERIPRDELPVIPGRPVTIMLADLVKYLERQRAAA